MKVLMPSPAIAIVGRHNSGKTTLIEGLIAELTRRGLNVGSVKHHSHVGFDFDIPGKDSYRHRAAGATESVIAAPGQIARVKSIEGEVECADIVASMPGHDIVVVEGYRKSGLPTIEIMRAENDADAKVAHAFSQASLAGVSLGADNVQEARRDNRADSASGLDGAPDRGDISNKMPTAATVAIVSDIPLAREAADRYGIPSFDVNAIATIADFVQTEYVRQRVSVVIQAGGESRRMGRSKATVPLAGHPLITRLVERLAPVADELIITTNEPENLAFLHDEFPDNHIRLVRDAFDYRGALPGLFTALESASNEYVAIVACDMVFASAALVAAECQEMSRTGADAVVPVNKHGYEPFHALYRKSTCISAVQKKLDEGDKRAQAIFPDIRICEFPQAKVLEVEPMGGCFVNVNTPEELEAIEKKFLEG